MLSDVSYTYPNSTKGTVFSNCDLSATQESRICIVGENGAGKTTLLKLMMDHISPTQGRRDAHRNLKFGYFSQHHVDQLDMTVRIKAAIFCSGDPFCNFLRLCRFALWS